LRVQSPEKTVTVASLVKPLDFVNLARPYFAKKWLRSIATRAGWIVPLFFLKRPSLHRRKDICIQMIDQFDESFDEFWSRVQDKYPAMVIRDRAFLNWRFAPVSGRRYHILVARAKDEM